MLRSRQVVGCGIPEGARGVMLWKPKMMKQPWTTGHSDHNKGLKSLRQPRWRHLEHRLCIKERAGQPSPATLARPGECAAGLPAVGGCCHWALPTSWRPKGRFSWEEVWSVHPLPHPHATTQATTRARRRQRLGSLEFVAWLDSRGWVMMHVEGTFPPFFPCRDVRSALWTYELN